MFTAIFVTVTCLSQANCLDYQLSSPRFLLGDSVAVEIIPHALEGLTRGAQPPRLTASLSEFPTEYRQRRSEAGTRATRLLSISGAFTNVRQPSGMDTAILPGKIKPLPSGLECPCRTT